MGRVVQDLRNQPAPGDQHDGHEGGDLGDSDAQRDGDLCPGRGVIAGVAEGRQQHQDDDHDEVLDDQPADSDTPAVGVQQPVLLQRFGEDDGAAAGEGEAEQQAGIGGPAEARGEGRSQKRGDGQLSDRAGKRSCPDRDQIGEREVQADREEQQDNADLGELVGQRLIGHESWREGADQDAGEQIADQRRDAQPVRRQTKAKGEHQTGCDRCDEWCFVLRHLALPVHSTWRAEHTQLPATLRYTNFSRRAAFQIQPFSIPRDHQDFTAIRAPVRDR